MASQKIIIKNERTYNATMKKIDALMRKVENNLTPLEAEEIRVLALAAQAYEKKKGWVMTLRILRTRNDNRTALARFEEIFQSKAGSLKGDEAGVLALLIKEYEDKHFVIPAPSL